MRIFLCFTICVLGLLLPGCGGKEELPVTGGGEGDSEALEEQIAQFWTVSYTPPRPDFSLIYYVDAESGDDANPGTSPEKALRTLARASELTLSPGQAILLCGGQTHRGALVLSGMSGTAERMIGIGSYGNGMARIDAKGFESGLCLTNVGHVLVKNLEITADGGLQGDYKIRSGVLVKTTANQGMFSDIVLYGLDIHDVYYYDTGYERDPEDTLTPNGEGKYGWGIRGKIVQTSPITGLVVANCTIRRVSHTGIRLEGRPYSDIRLLNNVVEEVGGPGMQFGYVTGGYVAGNRIDRSGSPEDSRNWKRGTGFWACFSKDVLAEKNVVSNANGPEDTYGIHIDMLNKNMVVQYNFSIHNAGGFAQILGGNGDSYGNNCYRYNVSINDGWRLKGVNYGVNDGMVIRVNAHTSDGAVGPYNSYIYNNTIYVDNGCNANISIEKQSYGSLIANNIVYSEREISLFQYPTDPVKTLQSSWLQDKESYWRNNLFNRQPAWAKVVFAPYFVSQLVGDPGFAAKGGLQVQDYIPSNREMVMHGYSVAPLPKDAGGGIKGGLKVEYDILGNRITGDFIGAIQP